MEYGFDARWRLPGWLSDYVIIRGLGSKNGFSADQVPVPFVISRMDSWLSSGHARILQDIYKELGGSHPMGLSVLERAQYDQRLKERIQEAFRRGELVALRVKQPQFRDLPPPLRPLSKPLPSRSGPEPRRTFIAIQLVDEEGSPVSGVRYRVELPDGVIREGTLNSRGEAREEHAIPGECKVTFPDLNGSDWMPASSAEVTSG